MLSAPAASALLSPAVVCGETIEQLRSFADADDPNFFTDLVSCFLEDGAALAHVIKHGALQQDWHNVQLAAHTLKSSCGNFGAQALADVCQRIEEQLRAQRYTELPELVPQVSYLFGIVRDTLQEAL